MDDLAALAARHAPQPPAGLVMARLVDGSVEVAASGPVAPGAVFELGSITKAVTGLLLADAIVRGEVEEGSTLDAFLEGARPLRLADLASHTAGLPRLPLAMLRRTGFIPESGHAVAAVTNSPKPVENAAKAAWPTPSRGRRRR